MGYFDKIEKADTKNMNRTLKVDKVLLSRLITLNPFITSNFWKIIKTLNIKPDMNQDYLSDTIMYAYGKLGSRHLSSMIADKVDVVRNKIEDIYRSNEDNNDVLLPFGDDFHEDYYTQIVALGLGEYTKFMRAPKQYIMKNRDSPFINFLYIFD